MKKFALTFVGITLALGFLAPFSASAQSGRKLITPLCFFKAVSGDPYVQYASRDADGAPQCPSPQTGYEMITPTSATSDSSVVALCWSRSGSAPNYSYETALTYQATTAGQPICDADLTNSITRGQFRPADSSPPVNTNGNNNGNTNNTGNGNTAGNNNGNTSTGGQIADCSDSGFHAVGPLCLPNNPFANSSGVAGSSSLTDLVVKIIRILLFFAGIVAVIMIIIGGYLYMTARGNDAQATSGRKTLVNAIIGLAIVILSYIIVQAVYSFLIK